MKVRMGGKILGTTPVKLTIPRRPPRSIWSSSTPARPVEARAAHAQAGDNGTHKVEFAKGKLVLKLQDGVEVMVDGKAVGTAPIAPLSLWRASTSSSSAGAIRRSAAPWRSAQTTHRARVRLPGGRMSTPHDAEHWRLHGVRVVRGTELDPNTAQTRA
jgi:hypothetical protein